MISRLGARVAARLATQLGMIAATVLVASAASAAPLSLAGKAAPALSPVEAVRLVCDQDCRCWHTAYQGHSTPRKAEVLLRDDVNACPRGGHYNGHYRTGPSVDLGFESRIPHTLPFPF